MKKILLLLMAIAIVTLSASATKIYVCGTKITGSTSFSAGGGTVNYNASSNTLTISNVDYTKTGSSNNGISVDEVSSDLTINLNGTVKFTIGDADAVLCKDANKHKTYININGTSTFISKSSGHAGLKLQDCDVYLQGSGTLTIQNINSSTSSHAIKGGTGNENLEFQIKDCEVESNGPQLYNLNEVYFGKTSYYDTGDYSSRSTEIGFNTYSGTTITYHAQNIKNWNWDGGVRIFLPIEYYRGDVSALASYDLAGQSCVISDYRPAVIVNSSYVPDYYLRMRLLEYAPYGYLTESQMNSRQSLNVSGKGISSLEGVEQFNNVVDFDCSNNNLTSLQYLPDPTHKTYLKAIYCQNNKITSIYLKDYSYLTTLNCSNNQIAISDPWSVLPTSLTYLNCANNKITKLDFNTGGYYTHFDHLTNLDCSNNPYLTEISSSNGQLTTLNVSGCTSLTKIVCDANKISSLSSIPSSVKNLNLSSNQLTSLPTLPSGLETLSATSNKFTSFSLSNHSSIKILQIGNNPNLTSLTINNNSKLEKVYAYAYNTTSSCTINCNNNSKLTILNVQESNCLKTLNCYGNTALTSLWLTDCSSLTTLDCHGSALTGIGDLNHCTALTTLICNSNQITSLNLTGCSALTYLSCQNNQIKSFTNLPTTLQTIYCNDNKLSGGTFDVSGRSALKILDIRNNPNFSGLKCNNCSLTSLSVSGCTGLTTLICNNNQLTSLDVSSLSNLTELKCHYNKLASLNVSNKTKLTTLYANANQLTSINVQGCSVLNDLNVECNKLTSLSVQGCNALRTINCCINKISASEANTLINSLCTIPSGSQGAFRYIYPGYSSSNYVENNVNLTDAQVRAARNKRWMSYKYVSGTGWVEIPVNTAIPGDVNGDGHVSSVDVTVLYNYLLNNDSQYIVNGDQDGDGIITSADIMIIYNLLLGN